MKFVIGCLDVLAWIVGWFISILFSAMIAFLLLAVIIRGIQTFPQVTQGAVCIWAKAAGLEIERCN